MKGILVFIVMALSLGMAKAKPDREEKSWILLRCGPPVGRAGNGYLGARPDSLSVKQSVSGIYIEEVTFEKGLRKFFLVETQEFRRKDDSKLFHYISTGGYTATMVSVKGEAVSGRVTLNAQFDSQCSPPRN